MDAHTNDASKSKDAGRNQDFAHGSPYRKQLREQLETSFYWHASKGFSCHQFTKKQSQAFLDEALDKIIELNKAVRLSNVLSPHKVLLRLL